MIYNDILAYCFGTRFLYFFICFTYIIYYVWSGRVLLYKRQKKDNKKTESIKDKILFSKYKEKIPALFYFYYYAVIIVNFVLIIIYFIFMAIPETVSYGKWILNAHFIFNSVWNLIPLIMFWQKNLRVNGYKYDRWLKK